MFSPKLVSVQEDAALGDEERAEFPVWGFRVYAFDFYLLCFYVYVAR